MSTNYEWTEFVLDIRVTTCVEHKTADIHEIVPTLKSVIFGRFFSGFHWETSFVQVLVSFEPAGSIATPRIEHAEVVRSEFRTKK